MPFQETTSSEDTFLDRWGHWVLWMGPYIVVVSIVAWTPRLMLLLAGVELLQFTLHARRYHQMHPLVAPQVLRPRLAFDEFALIMIVAGLLVAPFSNWVYVLVICQVTFSGSVHSHIHGRSLGLPALIGFGIASFWWGIFLTMQGVVPGLPFLRDFLL